MRCLRCLKEPKIGIARGAGTDAAADADADAGITVRDS